MAVCYDLNGNRKWIRFVENKPRNEKQTFWDKDIFGAGTSASPVLCGDLLLVHIYGLTALNTSSGQVIWKANANAHWGSPVLTAIGNEPVLVMTGGELVRVSDGKILTTGLGTIGYLPPVMEGYNAPVVQDGVVYYANKPTARAAKLPAQTTEVAAQTEPLWQGKLLGDRYGGFPRYYSSPVVSQGLVYALAQNNTLTVLDAVKGDTVYEQKLPLKNGCCYPNLTLAGKYLYASSDTGVTVVLEPGRAYKEIAINTLEPFRSTPIFDGKRMYVRTLKNLYCIGEL